MFCLTITLTSSFLGYVVFPGPLEGLKSILVDILGHTDSIESF